MMHGRKTSNLVIIIFIIFFYFSYMYRTRGPTVQTAKGPVTWEEVDKNVFLPMGYKIQDFSKLIPTLHHLVEPTCEQVFSNWLDIALSYIPKTVAPKSPAPELTDDYTLNGYATYHSSYYNQLSTSTPQLWDTINKWMTQPPHTFITYPKNGGMGIHHAMQYHSLDGGSGVVIGSLTPWVEVLALRAGASRVLTVEYQNTTIVDSNRVDYIHPFEFAKQFRRFPKFDFAASFSSLEHSGLERYGDPADPIGDIREVLKVRCMLKKNGLFFLGLPRSEDAVYYNELRVYGRIRLALMFAGFELLDVFRQEASFPADVQISDYDGRTWNHSTQDTFVLRKL